MTWTLGRGLPIDRASMVPLVAKRNVKEADSEAIRDKVWLQWCRSLPSGMWMVVRAVPRIDRRFNGAARCQAECE